MTRFYVFVRASRGPHTRSSQGPAGGQKDVEALLHVRPGFQGLPGAIQVCPKLTTWIRCQVLGISHGVAFPRFALALGLALALGAGIFRVFRRPPSFFNCVMFNVAPSELL